MSLWHHYPTHSLRADGLRVDAPAAPSRQAPSGTCAVTFANDHEVTGAEAAALASRASARQEGAGRNRGSAPLQVALPADGLPALLAALDAAVALRLPTPPPASPPARDDAALLAVLNELREVGAKVEAFTAYVEALGQRLDAIEERIPVAVETPAEPEKKSRKKNTAPSV